jgi:pimeloyl-ACP methyl ester carboxylesterase
VTSRLRLLDLSWLAATLAAIGFALVRLDATARGVEHERLVIDGVIPAELFRAEGAPAGPVVVVAHGFSGSSVLMRSLALTFARNGLAALAFDFPGHGRHPEPLEGDLFRVEGASARLVAATRAALAEARRLGDGRVALVGHSMAGDVIVRTAALEPDVAAVVAISLFSPAVTASAPRNLLVIAGQWEGRLAEEALRVAGLASAPEPAAYGATYGRFADGTARRAAVAPSVEHVGVLFAPTTLVEAQTWLDSAFGRPAGAEPVPVERGPWVLLLVLACVLLARPLLAFLPRLAAGGRPGSRRRTLLLPLAAATLVPPILLRLLPPDLLPLALADHFAAHLALFGLLLVALGRLTRGPDSAPVRPGRAKILLVSLAATLLTTVPVALAVDAEVTALPWTDPRITLRLVLFAGALGFFLGLEGAARARFGAPVALLAFLLSIAGSILLDRRLVFLGALSIVIVPVLATALLVARWTRRATGRPLPAATACAAFTAELLGGSLPLIADSALP